MNPRAIASYFFTAFMVSIASYLLMRWQNKRLWDVHNNSSNRNKIGPYGLFTNLTNWSIVDGLLWPLTMSCAAIWLTWATISATVRGTIWGVDRCLTKAGDLLFGPSPKASVFPPVSPTPLPFSERIQPQAPVPVAPVKPKPLVSARREAVNKIKNGNS